jgi:hypothetical protein
VALVANPWFLESFVVLDGAISGKSRIVVVEVVLAILGIALIVSGRRAAATPMPARTKLFASVAAGFALVMSIVFAEVFLRLIVGPGIVLEGEKWSEHKWRARQMAKDGVAQEGPYDYDRFDPLLGWLPKRNYRSDAIQTNSQGIRSKREFTFERTPGTRRIVFVGDSYTWGERTWAREITNEETFVSLIEERLPATEGLNMGVHGWGTDQQLIYLRQLGLKFQPDIVVLGFFEADITRNIANFFGYSKPYFELEGGELVLKNTPIATGDELLATPFELPSFYLGSLIRKGMNIVLDRTTLRPIEGRREWHVTRAIFEAARRDTEAAGAHFVLIDIPTHIRRRATPVEATVAKWAADTGTHFVSLREHSIQLPRNEWASVHDGHLTARGHEETAKALMAYFQKAGLLEAGSEPR